VSRVKGLRFRVRVTPNPFTRTERGGATIREPHSRGHARGTRVSSTKRGSVFELSNERVDAGMES